MKDVDFFIISGTSGSGKTIALQVLEDIGFYCIDNLPAPLMPQLAAQILASSEIKNCAISIDSRNRDFINKLHNQLDGLKSLNINYKIIFLDADTRTLLKRFSETRRKHPLSKKTISLTEAINKERKLLHTICDNADHKIDSTDTTPHELRSIIRNMASTSGEHSLTLQIQSFGFKYGPPADADFVFDVRCLPNPHWNDNLKALTGLDQDVENYFATHSVCADMFEHIKSFFDRWLPLFIKDNRSYVTVAVGCTGGQHRSVYITNLLKKHFDQNNDIQTQLRHRELGI